MEILVNYPEYKVTKDGRIWSIRSNKFLKNHINTNGYVITGLCINNKRKMMYLHIAVAHTYIENPEGKLFVNHKDGNKLNNNNWNLEWTTKSENELHAYSTGLKKVSNEQKKLLSDLGKLRVGNKSYVAKKVVNTETEEVFDTITSAAYSIGMKPTRLATILSSAKKNKTKFKYNDNN